MESMNEPEVLRDAHTLLLTPEGFQALQDELDLLTSTKRPEIAERIRESLQHGEFSEDNSELDEVKFEQAIVENRIGELKAMFSNAQMLEPDLIPTDHAGVGSLVTLFDKEFKDEFEIRLVNSIEADPNKDFISVESPMGNALFGLSVGEEAVVIAPGGKKVYVIKKIAR